MISLNETAVPDSSITLLSDQIFAPSGWLESVLGLEHRPQQASMARTTARALAGNQPLLFEAGTGVGKSLAYLIPGILTAVHCKRPFVVSSHTIALQEQIKTKDLEICRKLFAAVEELKPFKDFKFAMLVGRGNYLCQHRMFKAIETKGDLFGGSEQEELLRIIEWSNRTKTGLRDELSPAPSSEVWEWVNADSSACNKRNCTPHNCYYRKAQLQRRAAQVIIVNHSLLFSLISAGLAPGDKANGILYPDDFLVLDEAHTVPAIATEHIGLGISSYGIERALKLLYNSKPKPRGLLVKYGRVQHQTAVLKALATTRDFFSDLHNRLLSKRDVVRLRAPHWADPILNPALREVISSLQSILQNTTDRAVIEEISDPILKLETFLLAITEALELKNEHHVYWLEKTGRRQTIIHLRSAPLEIAEYLHEHLFNRKTTAILTSATLATGNDMQGFKHEIGAWDEEHKIEASPFDYERNCRIYLATDAPAVESTEGGRMDIDYLADMITFCGLKNTGGSLVLFTSFADMHKVAAKVEAAIANAGRKLLVQGQEYGRSKLKQLFVEAGNAILFGTDSFWTGFDVQGPALSQVIITRLPFANPSHPLAEARSEHLRKQGRSPFNERTLPDALIKFRQGIGRLIRSKTDRGVITILDSRILNKPYGRYFIQNLSHQTIVKLNRNNREKDFQIDGLTGKPA